MHKHTLSFTHEELKALANRLVPIAPSDYTQHDYAVLRHLYGRISRIESSCRKTTLR